MKKVFILIIVLAMLITTLASCANSGTGESTTAETTTPSSSVVDVTTERPYPTLPDKTYEGAKFTISYYDSFFKNYPLFACDLYSEKDDGSILSSAVYKRNKDVEARFDVNIELVTYNGAAEKATQRNDALSAFKSGIDTYQLFVYPQNDVFSWVNFGIIADANNLGVDFSQPWYSQSAMQVYSVNNKVLGIVSDFIYSAPLNSVATFYNLSLGTNLGIGSLYDIALDGKFTLDLMLQYAERVSDDLNNDGIMDQNDAYCLSLQNDSVYYFLHGAGLNMVDITDDGYKININSENSISVLQRIYKILHDKSLSFNRQTVPNSTVDMQVGWFTNNQTLFMQRPIATVYNLMAAGAEYEILPNAKFNSNQEKYYTAVNTYSAFVTSIPAATKDFEKTAAIIEMLSADSYYDIRPLLYDVVLDIRMSPNPKAASILDIIFDNMVYDVGMMLNIGNIRSTLVTKNDVNPASAIQAILGNMEIALSSLDGTVDKLVN